MYVRTLVLVSVVSLSLPVSSLAQEPREGDLVGPAPTIYTVQRGDTLAGVARQADVGLVELISANPGLTSGKLIPDTTLTLPTQHLLPARAGTGIIVNLAALRLFRFNADGSVESFPISVGREGWDTPTGSTTIVDKIKDPDWHVPASIRAQDPKLPDIVPAGPDNPLGQYAMHLEWPGYMIHGTNAPASIGKPSSHGCMRLYPEDIQALFGMSEVGDTVTVVETPITLGQSGDNLYIEVTPTRAQAMAMTNFKPVAPLDASDPSVQVVKAHLAELERLGAQVDEQAVDAAIARHDGIPVAVGHMPPVEVSEASSRGGGNSWWGHIGKAFMMLLNGIGAIFRRIWPG